MIPIRNCCYHIILYLERFNFRQQNISDLKQFYSTFMVATQEFELRPNGLHWLACSFGPIFSLCGGSDLFLFLGTMHVKSVLWTFNLYFALHIFFACKY